jgi:hypothetical protein
MAVYKLRNVETGYPYLLLPGIYLLGRSDDAHILVDCSSISRRHAQVHNLDNGVFVEDLGSHNGTWIADTYLEPSTATKLELGDIVYFGGVAFRLDPEVSHVPETAAPPKPSIPNERLKRPTEKVDVSVIKNVAQPKSGPIPTPAPAPSAPAPGPSPLPTPPAAGAAQPTVIVKHAPTFSQKIELLLIGAGIGLLLGLAVGLLF